MYGYGDLIKTTEYALRLGQRVITAGHSVCGRRIPAIIAGEGRPQGIIFGGIHAREHVTCRLVARLALEHRGKALIFVPMVNADGVELCRIGAESLPPEYRENALRINGGEDFSMWKANVRGVDINVNFDADWGKGKTNKRYPSPSDYIGAYPESEPETRVLTDLVRRYGITKGLAYHAKGEVIFYGYGNGEEHFAAARRFSALTGYPCMHSEGSCGGFKDWMVGKGLFALTVEVGSENLSYDELYGEFEKIYLENKGAAELLTEI